MEETDKIVNMCHADGQLEKIRRLVKQIQDAHVMGGALGQGLKRDRSIELAAAFEELDEHLSDNGMLPLAWLPPEAIKGGTAGTGEGHCSVCEKHGCHDAEHQRARAIKKG